MSDAVRELLDRERIRALCSAYAFAVDARDFERLREMWVPDARLAIYAGDPAPDALRFEARGQEAIVRALRGIERYPVTSHWLGGQEVWLEGDRARAHTRCLATHLFLQDGVRQRLDMAIRYHDRLVRVGDEWRFVERALAVDWESEAPLPARKRDRKEADASRPTRASAEGARSEPKASVGGPPRRRAKPSEGR